MKTDILVLYSSAELLKVVTDRLLKQFNTTDNKEVKDFLNNLTPDIIAAEIKLTDFLKNLSK